MMGRGARRGPFGQPRPLSGAVRYLQQDADDPPRAGTGQPTGRLRRGRRRLARHDAEHPEHLRPPDVEPPRRSGRWLGDLSTQQVWRPTGGRVAYPGFVAEALPLPYGRGIGASTAPSWATDDRGVPRGLLHYSRVAGSPTWPGGVRWATGSDHPAYGATILGGMAADVPDARSESDLPIEPVYDAAALDGFDAPTSWANRGSTPTPAASTPACTPAGRGRCASTPGSAPPGSRTRATTSSSRTAPADCRWRSTCRPRWATTPTRLSHGEVGKVGVAIDSIDDMQPLFDGLPLDECPPA